MDFIHFPLEELLSSSHWLFCPQTLVLFSPSELEIKTIKLWWRRPSGLLTSYRCCWRPGPGDLLPDTFLLQVKARLGEEKVFHIVRSSTAEITISSLF